MFVGLLKWLKNSLESEQHPTAPWPRYSRELTFRHYRARPFSCLGEFGWFGSWTGLVRGSRCVGKTL